MLRLRLPENVERAAGAVNTFAVQLWLTNENGSFIKVAKPLPLKVAALAADTFAPLPASWCTVSLLPAAGGGPKAAAAVGIDGQLAATLVVKLGSELTSGHHAPVAVRFQISADGEASVAPRSGGGTSGKGAAAGGAAAEAPRVMPVAPIITNAVHIGGTASGSAASGGAPAAAAATDAAGAYDCAVTVAHLTPTVAAGSTTAGGARASAGGARASASSAGAGGGGSVFLRIFESHMAITPGFGSIVWDGALLMGRYVTDNAAFFHGKRCVDLGTGTGIVGLAAAVAGAHAVLTDLDAMLPLVSRNAAAAAPAIKAAGGSACVAALPWGEPDRFVLPSAEAAAPSSATATTAAAASAATAGRARGPKASGTSALIDAATGQLRAPFDVVFASECAYNDSVFATLCRTFLLACGIQPPTSEEALLAGPPAAAAAAAGDGSGVPDPATAVAAHIAAGGPLLVFGTRPRSLCDIEVFLALLDKWFHMHRLVARPAAAAATGAAGGKGGDKRGGAGGAKAAVKGAASTSPACPLSLYLSPDLELMADHAAFLSKTNYRPILFLLAPRAGVGSS